MAWVFLERVTQGNQAAKSLDCFGLPITTFKLQTTVKYMDFDWLLLKFIFKRATEVCYHFVLIVIHIGQSLLFMRFRIDSMNS